MVLNIIDACVINSGLSQTQIANKIGVTRFVVSNWRKSGIPLKHVKAMSEITGINKDLLAAGIQFKRESKKSSDSND